MATINIIKNPHACRTLQCSCVIAPRKIFRLQLLLSPLPPLLPHVSPPLGRGTIKLVPEYLKSSLPWWFSGKKKKKKKSPASAEDVGLIPGLGRSPGEGNGNPL